MRLHGDPRLFRIQYLELLYAELNRIMGRNRAGNSQESPTRQNLSQNNDCGLSCWNYVCLIYLEMALRYAEPVILKMSSCLLAGKKTTLRNHFLPILFVEENILELVFVIDCHWWQLCKIVHLTNDCFTQYLLISLPAIPGNFRSDLILFNLEYPCQ